MVKEPTKTCIGCGKPLSNSKYDECFPCWLKSSERVVCKVCGKKTHQDCYETCFDCYMKKLGKNPPDQSWMKHPQQIQIDLGQWVRKYIRKMPDGR